jgi:hypothetical protein
MSSSSLSSCLKSSKVQVVNFLRDAIFFFRSLTVLRKNSSTEEALSKILELKEESSLFFFFKLRSCLLNLPSSSLWVSADDFYGLS